MNMTLAGSSGYVQRMASRPVWENHDDDFPPGDYELDELTIRRLQTSVVYAHRLDHQEGSWIPEEDALEIAVSRAKVLRRHRKTEAEKRQAEIWGRKKSTPVVAPRKFAKTFVYHDGEVIQCPECGTFHHVAAMRSHGSVHEPSRKCCWKWVVRAVVTREVPA